MWLIFLPQPRTNGRDSQSLLKYYSSSVLLLCPGGEYTDNIINDLVLSCMTIFVVWVIEKSDGVIHEVAVDCHENKDEESNMIYVASIPV